MAPEGDDIRPTTDRVREALFTRLHALGLIQNALVLDAFAGTGALGLEALSRGARHVTFFDTSQTARKLVQANAESLSVLDSVTIERRDATKPRDAIEPCDLLFLDPPYGKGIVERALPRLDATGWISDEATVIAEMAPRDAFEPPEFLEITDDRKYGDIRIVTLHRLS